VAWERVYTINDFWDGPRFGVADVSGRPHIYESPFDSGKDNFEDFFVVSPSKLSSSHWSSKIGISGIDGVRHSIVERRPKKLVQLFRKNEHITMSSKT